MFGDFFRGRVPSLWADKDLAIPELAADIYDDQDKIVIKAEA